MYNRVEMGRGTVRPNITEMKSHIFAAILLLFLNEGRLCYSITVLWSIIVVRC